MDAEPPVTRAELDELRRRVAALEAAAPDATARRVRCAFCRAVVIGGRFCSACGAPLATPAPAPPSAPAPPRPAPAHALPRPGAAAPPGPPTAPLAGVASPRARTPPSLETALGQRWAPRVGAALVFLGVVFFLGVAVQRGWIGPVAQLALAASFGVALVAFGAVLTARRGYGTYPAVLEATGSCVLYVTAFVAHALPYYRRVTGLTEVGSGVLMAIVALGTVALALARGSRVIVGLGYALAFLTALLGVGPLAGLTLAYVALLGTSLAVVVAAKRWHAEALAGTVLTGAFLLALALRGRTTGDPEPWATAIVALVPALTFLWLAARRATGSDEEQAFGALLTLATFAWAPLVTLAPLDADAPRGALLLLWALGAALHAGLAARLGAPTRNAAAAGAAAVVLWILGAPLAWNDAGEARLLATATYALAALAVGAIATRAGRGTWIAALALAAAAALSALLSDGLLRPPWEAGAALGPWQAWVTLPLVLAPLALAAASRTAHPPVRAAAFALTAAFGTLWTFALFGAPLPATLWLLLLASGLLALGAATRGRDAVGASALLAAYAVLALAAVKSATVDTYATSVRLDAVPALLQALLVAAALLALFHLGRARGLLAPDATALAAPALIGGSAVVLVNYLLAYATGPWPSILTGVTGVAYLAAGFLLRREPTYRYAGFGALGFVILRVFLVDMQNTDLAIRALVFAVLGGILLGIGYAYARMSRRGAT